MQISQAVVDLIEASFEGSESVRVLREDGRRWVDFANDFPEFAIEVLQVEDLPGEVLDNF